MLDYVDVDNGESDEMWQKVAKMTKNMGYFGKPGGHDNLNFSDRLNFLSVAKGLFLHNFYG